VLIEEVLGVHVLSLLLFLTVLTVVHFLSSIQEAA
jgi:hypothetical protein